MKIYTSKLGLKFAISAVQRPMKDGVIFITQREMDWIKEQNLEPEEFKALWLLKSEDHRYDPIPERAETEAQKLANEYAPKIIDKLKGRA